MVDKADPASGNSGSVQYCIDLSGGNYCIKPENFLGCTIFVNLS